MKQSTLEKWVAEMSMLDAFVESLVSDDRVWTEEGDDPKLTIDYHGDKIVVLFIVDQAAVSCGNDRGDFACYPGVSDIASVAYFIGRAAEFLNQQQRKGEA